MHIAARRLGMDPVELARRNLVRAEQMPYRAAAGAVYDWATTGVPRARARLAGYDDLRAEQARGACDGRLLGIGLACVVEPSVSNMGYITLAQTARSAPPACPRAAMPRAYDRDGPHGGVTLRITTTPQGQGHRTVAAQVAADVLGLGPEQIDVRTDADTAANPWTVSSGNYSSRFAAMGASAVHLAARVSLIACSRSRRRSSAARRRRSSSPTASARVRGDAERSVSIRRLAGAAHWHPSDLTGEAAEGLALTVTYTLPICSARRRTTGSTPRRATASSPTCASWRSTRETAEIAVHTYVTVHDAGRVLNPMLADGQIRGGLAHGLGAALLEEHRWDEDGNLMTATFLDYLPPTATELPRVVTAHLESPSPLTPLGAKGLGEGNTMSAPAAIANAVADALGIDSIELPATPQRIWELL